MGSCRKIKVCTLIARGWALQCENAYGEKVFWPGQIVRLATLHGIPQNCSGIPSTQIPDAADCARSAKCNVHDSRWDNWHQKRNSRPPAFRHKEPGEPLWLDCMPAWVDARTDQIAPSWTSLLDHADQLTSPKVQTRFTADYVRKLCQQGQVERAVEALQVLAEMNSAIDKYLLYFVLKECMGKKDVMLCGQVHALSVQMGFGSDTFLCNHFIRMYAAHGKLQEAMDVFSGVALPNAFMWSSIISAHVRQGQAERAIKLYQHMRATRMKPDGHVLVAALQACAAAGNLEVGKQVQDDVFNGSMEHDMFVCSCLVDMLAKCGSLKDARTVFDRLSEKNVVTWNAMIAGYARVEGMGEEALSLYSAMCSEGMVAPSAVTFVCLLQACANTGFSALETGKQLQLQLEDRRLESDVAVGCSLVTMYVKCGSLKDARRVFNGLREKKIVTWTAMIAGYAQQEGMGQEALSLYGDMHNEGMVAPDAVTFICLLQACANVGVSALEMGKQLHSQVKDARLESDVVVGGSLVNMYAKCGSLKDARIVFDALGEKNVVTWNSIISGYAQQEGMGEEALKLYSDMCNEGMVTPDAVTFLCLLQACSNVGVPALETGKQLHSQLKNQLLGCDVVVGGSLVNMYVKCGSLEDARSVFNTLGEKNVATWTAMLAGYAQERGLGHEALSLYTAMHTDGLVVPDAVTFVYLLQACANVGVSGLENGRLLHSQLKERRLESDVVVCSSLVNMYAKCGGLTDARNVFDGLDEKNVVTWNAMIAAYAQQEGMGQEALNLYSTMHNGCISTPNAVTFVCLLQACANVGASALERAKQLHLHLKESKLDSDVVVGGSLVNMYVKCGSLEDARLVFEGLGEKNVVTWNAMISGYAQQEGMGQEALNVFSIMQNEGITVPDAVTFVCLLQACANLGVSALERGKQLHSQVKDLGLESDLVVGGSLVNMYAKCGSPEDGRVVFDGLGEKNVVTWNAMIAGYAQQEGMGQEALNIYMAMRNEGTVTPDSVTYVCLLEACASVGALQQGKQLHSKIREGGFESNVLIGTCLVKMYAKCGGLEVSREIFDTLPVKDLVTWNALLKGYAEHGEGGMAVRCFEELLEQGLVPNEVTYTCLFTACSHAGLVDQAQQYFETMVERHKVEPTDQHCNCMVDLLGRSGQLDRAEHMLRVSGLAGNAVGWTALLSACKSYGDAELGRRCFDHLVSLEPTVASAYVLLGSIYSSAGRWEEVERVESLRKAAGAKKMAAKACIEVKNEVHEFTVGEERSDVAATLRKMNAGAKNGGHVPQTQLVLRAVSEQQKEDALCGHAEKLALAYGLLHTPAGSPLVVTKNLRMCDDCHSSTKIMSRLEKRNIVVRDGHKVHRFQDGTCSCQDRP